MFDNNCPNCAVCKHQANFSPIRLSNTRGSNRCVHSIYVYRWYWWLNAEERNSIANDDVNNSLSGWWLKQSHWLTVFLNFKKVNFSTILVCFIVRIHPQNTVINAGGAQKTEWEWLMAGTNVQYQGRNVSYWAHNASYQTLKCVLIWAEMCRTRGRNVAYYGPKCVIPGTEMSIRGNIWHQGLKCHTKVSHQNVMCHTICYAAKHPSMGPWYRSVIIIYTHDDPIRW